MATATITAETNTDTATAAPKGGGKKKLLLIVLAAVLLLALAGGGAAFLLLKKKASAANEDGGDEPAAAAPAPAPAKAEIASGAPPVFVPLEPFTVNLADKEAERYAQVGLTLEVDSTKTSDAIKSYMPAIRNNILMLLSAKTAAEMLSREGKLKLVRDIQRESLRPLGIRVPIAHDDDDASPPRKQARPLPDYPIRAVHFSNIIVQ